MSGASARTARGVGEHHRQPARADGDDLSGRAGGETRAERTLDLGDGVGPERFERRGRRLDRDPPLGAGALDRKAEHAGGAFLPQLRPGGDEAGLEHRVRAAYRRMAGEGQLGARREDPQAVVRARGGRAQYEGRLREVRPGGDALHRGRVEPVAVEDDRDRVAEEGPGGEDVDLLEA